MTTLTRIAASPQGRHTGRRRIRSFISIRSMMMTTFALLIAICLAGVATGGTYALWNSAQPAVAASTIRSGNAELTVTTALAMPTTVMYPGLTVYGSAALQNTGTIPLTLRTTGLTVPTPTVFSQALTVGFATAANATNCGTGVVTSAWVYSTFASPTVGPIGTPLAVGSTAVLCVSAQLADTAASTAQGEAAANFVVAMDGIQG